MGSVSIVVSFIWLKVIHGPKHHPHVNAAELDCLKQGCALVDMDLAKQALRPTPGRSGRT
jgi:ACS family glucarate transporter-like MFS transporter